MPLQVKGRLRGAVPGVVTALVTLALMVWALGRPAFWVDESASVVATQRSWGGLVTLLHGAEAPLVPYYFLLKATSGVSADLVGGIPAHPEALYRWPSAVAIALTAGFLVSWLARRTTLALAVSSVVVLLISAGTSRYAQEARPYAFTALTAVIASAIWWRMMLDRSRRWVAFYAVAVGALVVTHLLSASLVIAHLVAVLAVVPAGRRFSGLVRTVLGAAIGTIVVSPYAAIAALHAKGPGTNIPVTPDRWWKTFSTLFDIGSTPWLGIGVVVVLAAIGLSQTVAGPYTSIARLATAWALVPLVVLLPPMLVHPALLRLRYLVFLLPAWAIMGGLGVVTLGRLAVAVLRRFGAPARAATTAGLVVGAVVLGLATWNQAPTLRAVRAPGGHGENSRPALALVDTAANAGLPIVTGSKTMTLMVGVYARHDESRLLGVTIQRDLASIWPVPDPAAQTRAELAAHPRIILLQRQSIGPTCRNRKNETPAEFADRCMPRRFYKLGYRAVQAESPGRSWTVAVLQRP